MPIGYAEDEIKVMLNGKQLTFDVPPTIIEGRTMLPLRAIFEAFGANVDWNDKESRVKGTKGSTVIELQINNKTAKVNGLGVELDVPGTLMSGRTMVPARFIAETFGAKVEWIEETSTVKITYAEKNEAAEKAEVENIESEQGITTEYDKNWFEKDREKFKDIVKQVSDDKLLLKNTIYSDYVKLSNDMNKIDKKAYRGGRGYILYSPELSEEIDIVSNAIKARLNLLKDIEKGTIKGVDDYYPNKRYDFVDLSNTSIDIKPTDKFIVYNQKLIIDKLDSLPVPDYYLYGNRIFFINGEPSYPMAAYNNSYSKRGTYDDFIVIFNTAKTYDHLLSTLYHEIGHSVQYEIFKTYQSDNFYKNENNTKNMDEYASFYRKDNYSTDYSKSWGSSIGENFAEDFSRIFYGGYKASDWKEDHDSQVKKFIEDKISEIDYNKIPIAKEVKLFANAAFPYITTKFNPGSFIITGENTFKVKVDGLKAEGEQTGVIVYTKNQYKVFEFNGNNECVIELPAYGEYIIIAGVIISDSKSGGKKIGKTYFSYSTVLYGNMK
jgi:hypothetical protein